MFTTVFDLTWLCMLSILLSISRKNCLSVLLSVMMVAEEIVCAWYFVYLMQLCVLRMLSILKKNMKENLLPLHGINGRLNVHSIS